MKNLVIVGGGFSGSVLAAQFLRHCPASSEGVRLILIERSARIARGLAYATTSPQHFLNVPVGNMSALADKTDDFLHFCKRQAAEVTEEDFVPRHLYGDYLADLLQLTARGAAPGVELQQRVADVRAIHPDANGVIVELGGDEVIHADHVVLAVGHFAPVDPTGLPVTQLGAHHYCADPWQGDALADLPVDAPVLLLGSGLTALDMLLELLNRGHRGEIAMLSRRGLLPKAHRRQRDEGDRVAGLRSRIEKVAPKVRDLTRHVRREITACAGDGGDWRDVFAALRPITPQLWQRLSAVERRRFLRHVQPYWDVHRHRVAPALHQRLQQALADGQIRSIAGRLHGAQLQDNRVHVELRPRGTDDTVRLSVVRIINCTGPNANLARVLDPLICQLRDAGIICPDEFGLGLDVDNRLTVKGAGGEFVSRLSYLGPMLKAGYWESIAVPELRRHALELALHLRSKYVTDNDASPAASPDQLGKIDLQL